MELGNTIKAEKISKLNRMLNVSFKKIFLDLAGIGVAIGTKQYGEAVKSGLSAVIGISSEDNDPIEHRAFVLAYNAMRHGLLQLVKDSARFLREHNDIGYEAEAFEQLAEKLDFAFEEKEILLDEDFFKKPDQTELLGFVKPQFKAWLELQGLPKATANQIAKRLDFYFVKNVDALLADKADYFQIIHTKTSRSPAQKRLWGRHLYNQSVIAKWKEGIFDEPFGLDEIYVGLNCCYPIVDKDAQTKHRVVESEEQIWQWLKSEKPNFKTLVLRGGPGSGKSSLMKKIGKRLAEEEDRPFYIIPLQYFKFQAGIKEGILAFIQSQKELKGLEDPFSVENIGNACKTVFIFDGLDELSRSGKSGEQIAKDLMSQLTLCLSEFNAKKEDWDLRAIVTGRDLIVQQSAELNAKAEGQVLELLPYALVNREEEWRGYDFEDAGKKLETDLRTLWWVQYWKAKGEQKRAIPDEIKHRDYDSLSCQPLLSYLLARAFSNGHLDKDTRHNINIVYERLINDVRVREWDGVEGHKHTSLGGNEFIRLLEELAISAWQSGDVRATTRKAFEERCQNGELKTYLKEFNAKNESNATDLMVSFFSRKSGNDADGEGLIEFTHKSFGEYLVARRIVGTVEHIVEGLKTPKYYKQENAIKDWLDLTASEEITEYIWEFLRREVALRYHDKSKVAGNIQKTLVYLFSSVITDGFPTSMLENENTNLDIISASRNAESSLLLTISAFARVSGEPTEINWKDDPAYPKQVLSRLMLGGGGLFGKALFACTFPKRTDFYLMNLERANLDRAHLEFANLIGANLDRAHLEFANLIGAQLQGAQLQGAQLQGANLERANLHGADLQDANLIGAQLQDAHLQDAILRGANLRGAYLQGAKLHGAILQDANLQDANLQDANLQGAYLHGAYLHGAQLQDANLQDANLQHANLLGANLVGANLQNTNLKGASLYDAKIYPFKLGDKVMEGQEAYDYLVKQGALNVPKP